MKKPDVRMNGTAMDKPWGVDDWKGQYPELTDMLLCSKWDDATYRVTSTLLIFVEDGVLKACLNDRHYQRSAFFTDVTMESLLTKIEVALASGTADFRSKGNRSQGPGQTPF